MATPVERTVGSVRLATIEAGEGGRPLLISHGFTGAKEDFADVVDPLADAGWWVVAPDLRGHGASDQPDREEAYSLAVFAEDLFGLADQLGWDRFALLGHSMGGMIAQEMALGRPERIDRLVLMSTSHGPIDELDPETVEVGVAILREQGLPALLEMLTLLPKAEPTPSEVRVRAERPGYVEFADGKVHRCSGAMYAAMGMELTSRHDRLDDLAAGRGGLRAAFADGGGIQAEDGRHRADTHRHRLLHRLRAQAHQRQGIGQGQCARGDQRAVLAQRMPGHRGRSGAALGEPGPPAGDACGQHHRLGVGGEVELFLGAAGDQAGDVLAERRGSFFQCGTDRRVVAPGVEHADGLRALPRKNKCE